MNETEAEEIIQRTGAVNDAWRSKVPRDMTDAELATAKSDTLQAKFAAEAWYESQEPMDYEDRAYAYECLQRNTCRLADFEKEADRRKAIRSRFDVV